MSVCKKCGEMYLLSHEIETFCKSCAKLAESAPSASDNSRYVTALRSVLLDDTFTDIQVSDIIRRVEQRLNAEEPHCT